MIGKSTQRPSQVRQLAIHGAAVELQCEVPNLRPSIERLLGTFATMRSTVEASPIIGGLHPFETAAVQRSISSSAVSFSPADELIELYREGERFWVVDDRWGMAELNLLRRQWRSWVLPQPSVDPLACVEMAVLWPLAQLLRGRGLHLLPAVSIARNGWGTLIICPFGIGAELNVLVRNGYRILGQRWTVLTEENERVAMRHMPGFVERIAAPSRSVPLTASEGKRLDLTLEFPGSQLSQSFCDEVFIVVPGRRTSAEKRELPLGEAMNRLRQCWPIIDLQPDRHGGQLPPKLARMCRCAQLQLSRDPTELMRLLDGSRKPAAKAPVHLSLHLKPLLRRAV